MEAWLASFPFKSAANRKRAADENGEIRGVSENAVLAVATQILGRKCQDLEDQVIPLAEQLLRVPQGTLARHERSHKSLEEHATQVLLGCAVECRDRDLYIASILKLDAAAQITLKAEIEDLFELIRSRVSSNGSGAADDEGQDENDTPNEEGVVDHEIEAHDQGIAPQFDDDENEVLEEEEEEEEEEIGDGAADTTPSRKSPRGTHFTIHASLADASVDSTGGLADEVEQLKARVHELTQEKLVLEQNTIEQDGVCEDLRTQMSVLQARLEDDRASAAAENLAMSSRGGAAFDAEAQVLELQEALEAARLRESELDTALRARQQAQSTIDELNQRISAYEKEMQGASQLKDSLQRSELAVERLVNDLQAYKSTVKELREERDSLRDRIREVSSSAGSSLNLSARSLGSASASPSVSASASASASPGSGRRQSSDARLSKSPIQSKIEALRAMNARLERQVREMDTENREVAGKLRTAQQELDVARQSSEAEIKEWADYAHSLEGDRAKKEALVVKLRETSTALEVLNTNYIELQKDMGESKREIDFWSQKVQDLHHDFTIVRKERDVLADHLGCAMETQRMQLEDHEATMRQRSGADAMRRRLTREFNAKLTDLMRKMARLQSEIEVEREARRMACARYEKLVEEVPRQVAAQVQERVGALQDAEEPGLRKLVQLFSSADSPAVRGQSRVRRNLDAMVKDLISTPRGKDAEASSEVRGTTGREVERDVAQLRDVNERLGRENEWLREQFEARGAPPSPSIDFDSAEGGSDSLVVAGRGARAGGASGVARHLRQALVELQRENAALRKANVAEIEERARMQGELHSLRKELDRLRLKSIHASTKMIREKRVPAEAVTLWFNAELERVSVKAEELATSSMSFVAPGSVARPKLEDGDAKSSRAESRRRKSMLPPRAGIAPSAEKENFAEQANAHVSNKDTDDLCNTFASASDLREATDEVPAAAHGANTHVKGPLSASSAKPFKGAPTTTSTFETPKQHLGQGRKTFGGKRAAKSRAYDAARSKCGESGDADANARAAAVAAAAASRRGGHRAARHEPASPADSIASWSSAELAAHARRKRQNANHSFESVDSESFFRALQHGDRASVLHPAALASARTRAVHRDHPLGAARRIFNESMDSAQPR